MNNQNTKTASTTGSCSAIGAARGRDPQECGGKAPLIKVYRPGSRP